MMIYTAVAPTLMGVCKVFNNECPIWGYALFQVYILLGATMLRSTCSTKSQIIWEWLAGCYNTCTATGSGGPNWDVDTVSTGVTSDRGGRGQAGFSKQWVQAVCSNYG